MALDKTLPNVRVITQSCIRIEGADGTVVYSDPFKMTDEPHDATYILITHAHYDHYSPQDLAKVANKKSIVIAPASMPEEVAALDMRGRAHMVSAGSKIELPGITIEAVPAYNTDPDRLHLHPRSNQWLGYVITLDGVRYYLAGDTDQNEDNERVSCDVALVPIGGTFTMDPAQAAAFVNTIKPEVAVPIHYGSIVGTMADADTFAAAVDPAITVVKKMER